LAQYHSDGRTLRSRYSRIAAGFGANRRAPQREQNVAPWAASKPHCGHRIAPPCRLTSLDHFAIIGRRSAGVKSSRRFCPPAAVGSRQTAARVWFELLRGLTIGDPPPRSAGCAVVERSDSLLLSETSLEGGRSPQSRGF